MSQPSCFTVFTAGGETYSLENATGLRLRLAKNATPEQVSGPIYLLPLVQLPSAFVRAHDLADDDGRVPLERLLDPATLRVLPKFADLVRLEFTEPSLGNGWHRPIVASFLRLAPGVSA